MKAEKQYSRKGLILKLTIALISLVALSLIGWWRVIYAGELPRSWDQVDFSLALSRFDLFAMQPHFPGYPYFILGGMLFNSWIENPSTALSVFNSALLLTSVYPLYSLSRSILSKSLSIMTVAIFQSMIFINVMSVQPMSEASAVAVLWWYIWSVKLAYKKSSSLFVLLSSFIFSILLGIRLSYIPFGIGLLALFLQKKSKYASKREYLSFLGKQIGFAVMFQLIWVAGLAASEGGVAAFMQLALGFSTGHFKEWGGTAVSNTAAPFLERLTDLMLYNIGWTGLAGQHLAVIVLVSVVAITSIFLAFLERKNLQVSWFAWTYVAMFLSYLLWALFAQNIEKPRHILPLPGMLLFVCTVYFVAPLRKLQAARIGILTVLLLIQVVATYSALEESRKPAAVHKLTSYLSEVEEPLMVYTWEETRVMDYVDAPFQHDRVYTYATFRSQLPYYEDRKVFLTKEVVQGFLQQGAPIEDSIQRVDTFYSNQMYDPVYHKIVLYEYKR